MSENADAGTEVPPNESILKKDDSWLAITILVLAGLAALIIGFNMLKNRSKNATNSSR